MGRSRRASGNRQNAGYRKAGEQHPAERGSGFYEEEFRRVHSGVGYFSLKKFLHFPHDRYPQAIGQR
ncbi:MAG TPA: hypothetical protein VJ323_01705, partial [Bryobacteraceae bacterium]|nr:hypothetical protein [Bryobacteraceae bacterium]